MMDEKIRIAFGAASTACHAVMMPRNPADRELTPVFDGTTWPFMGKMPEAIEAARDAGSYDAYEAAFMERLAPLVDFVRDFPSETNIEALYRHARSHGVHDRPSEGFDDVPAAFRIAYAVFRATLIEADRVFLEEERRASAKAAAERPQAPVMVAAEDTILEQHGSILEKVGDKAPLVNLGGPQVSEGEGGDAAEHLEQPAGGGADQGHVDAAAAADGGGDAASVSAAISGDDQHDGGAVSGQLQEEAGGAPAADDAGGAEGVAGGATQLAQPDGVAGAAAADTPHQAAVADALEAKAKALSPARKKR